MRAGAPRPLRSVDGKPLRMVRNGSMTGSLSRGATRYFRTAQSKKDETSARRRSRDAWSMYIMWPAS